jgi:hypothetical protein
MERQQVMHAQRAARNRARENELVVALVVGERRRPERLRRQHLRICGRHAPRRLAQARLGHVGAERAEQVGCHPLNGMRIDAPTRLALLLQSDERHEVGLMVGLMT